MLETSLMEILDIASQWYAILLDGAGIYLEQQTSNGDPSPASMMAISIRMLEYYQGVLFLTTNRVTSFNDAICSRIPMFLRYHRLNDIQSKKVWGNFLARARVKDADLTLFARIGLNCREICNTIRIALSWTNNGGVELTTPHVLRVVQIVGKFHKDLQEAINEDGKDQQSFSASAIHAKKEPKHDQLAKNGDVVL